MRPNIGMKTLKRHNIDVPNVIWFIFRIDNSVKVHRNVVQSLLFTPKQLAVRLLNPTPDINKNFHYIVHKIKILITYV